VRFSWWELGLNWPWYSRSVKIESLDFATFCLGLWLSEVFRSANGSVCLCIQFCRFFRFLFFWSVVIGMCWDMRMMLKARCLSDATLHCSKGITS
jgi:hypothetical protein